MVFAHKIHPSEARLGTKKRPRETRTMFSRIPDGHDPTPPPAPPSAGAVEELSLLLPAWQVKALEEAAFSRGVTTAAMLRRVIEEFFRRTTGGLNAGVRQWA